MSLQIHITKEQIEAELKRNQPLTPGWYEFELTDVNVMQSKDKNSVNYVVRHTLVKDPYRYIDHYFNSQPFGQTFMVRLFAALNNVTIADYLAKLGSEFDLNFENIKGKKVMGKVIHNLGTDKNAGKIFNNIEDWAAIGSIPF